MIVDLLRNDLGRTCRIGSVRVPELFSLESYPNVHHLVSSVTGELADDRDALDLIAGSFPGGSITGAPKIRAMQIIDELEPTRRGLYCGSLLYLDVRGEMDSSIAIRSCWSRMGRCVAGGRRDRGRFGVAGGVSGVDYQGPNPPRNPAKPLNDATPVAEGCDLLILFLNNQDQRSQPSAAPTEGLRVTGTGRGSKP
jgi:hypothetical protein